MSYRQKWLPPPSMSDYMYEVQHNIWWDHKDRAKRQLLWLMETFLGDDNAETPVSKGESFTEEEGEDDCYTVGRRYAD